MRASTLLAFAAAILAFAGLASGPARAGGDNPNGYGIYSPADPQLGVYRYDPRSWYYRRPGHYPYYASSYWVPRAEMRHRYRYLYHGPRHRYHPAWGYPRRGHTGGDGHFGNWAR